MTQHDRKVLSEGSWTPSESVQASALACMEMWYPLNPVLEKNWSSYEAFREALKGLDFSSSPGFPYMRTAPSIGLFLGHDGMLGFDESRVEILWYDTCRVFAGSYDHWFRAFVKDEPHKISKASRGAWRLIFAASLPVQMAWRMAFVHQNDLLNTKVFQTPSFHGLSFSSGNWRRFLAYAHSKNLTISRDLSNWDVMMPGWVADLVYKFRSRFGPVTDDWLVVTQRLYEDAFGSSKILFSNGLVVQQNFKGFMKSGLYSTIADNSLAMVLMHLCVSISLGQRPCSFIATGDDTVQSTISDSYLDLFESMGLKIKEVHHHLEFMGTNFETGLPIPMYPQKHFTKIRQKMPSEDREQTFDAYLHLYSHDTKMWTFWRDLALKLNLHFKSQNFYKFWFDSPMASLVCRILG